MAMRTWWKAAAAAAVVLLVALVAWQAWPRPRPIATITTAPMSLVGGFAPRSAFAVASNCNPTFDGFASTFLPGKSSFGRRACASAALTTDGPDGWYFPTTAAHFVSRGLPAPDQIFNLGIASGNATDYLGGAALTANGTPLYQQNISTGTWTHKRVGFNQTNAQRFAFETGAGPNPAATSVAWLLYLHDVTVPAVSGRTVFVLSSPAAGSAAWIDHTTGNLFRLRSTAGSPAFVNAPAANIMMLVVWNRTAGTYRAYTTQEQVNGTYDASIADGRKGLGGALNSGGASSTGGFSLAAYWTGANAELVDTKATLTALGATLPY